jgi:hypothetical protein
MKKQSFEIMMRGFNCSKQTAKCAQNVSMQKKKCAIQILASEHNTLINLRKLGERVLHIRKGGSMLQLLSKLRRIKNGSKRAI